jgi:hypothetical protein
MKQFYTRAARYIAREVRNSVHCAVDTLTGTYSSDERAPLRHLINPLPASILNAHKAALIAEAEELLAHRFTLLGATRLQFPADGEPTINASNRARSGKIARYITPGYQRIDWQLDAKCGVRWASDQWHWHVRFGSNGADIKVPWELGRLQHLPRIALAYGIDSNDRWLREFQNQTLDFLSANPPRFGVNWFCAMDGGIRVANLLLAFDLFRTFGAQFEPWFTNIFTSAVREHARHIRNHLEWGRGRPNNHLLAGLAGLLFATAYLPPTIETWRWARFAKRELLNQTQHQFHPDGSNVEGSTSYHRFAGEMVVFATALMLTDRPACQLPAWLAPQIWSMRSFTRDITAGDQTVPQIGDDDGGRFFHLLPAVDGRDHSQFLNAAGALFGRSGGSCLHAAVVKAFISARVLPLTVPPRFKAQTPAVRPPLEGHRRTVFSLSIVQPAERFAYPDFGLFVFKSPELYLAIRCSANRVERGNHAHHDHLSIELHYRGQILFRDPGTYAYTSDPESRRRYRSLAAHATPFAIAASAGEPVFGAPETALSKCLYFGPDGFAGEAIYLRTNRVTRHLIISDSLVEVIDCYATQPGEQQPEALFYSPGYGQLSAQQLIGGRTGTDDSIDAHPDPDLAVRAPRNTTSHSVAQSG